MYLNAEMFNHITAKDKKLLDTSINDLVNDEPQFERHINCYTYQGREPQLFLKIDVVFPPLVRHARLLLQAPYGMPEGYENTLGHDYVSWLPAKFRNMGIHSGFTVLEAHVDYTTRFLVDKGLDAAGAWFVFNKSPVAFLDAKEQKTQSNIEIITHHKNIRGASQAYVETHPPVFVDAKFDIYAETPSLFSQACSQFSDPFRH